MCEREIRCTTPAYFYMLCDVHRQRIEAEEAKEKAAWERMRLLAWWSVQVHIEPRHRKSLHQFMRLPWDNVGAEVDIEEARKRIRSAKWAPPVVDLSERQKGQEVTFEDIRKATNG
ncbi:MAG: hypothetical protein KatS3mg031_2994 [Chitinophagales bacterium]|nr:MAG: hypothetical protein KatS3mg031_2994 [Chitinophagales bacterium]